MLRASYWYFVAVSASCVFGPQVGIVNQEPAVFRAVHDKQWDTAQEGVAHVEHPVGQPGNVWRLTTDGFPVVSAYPAPMPTALDSCSDSMGTSVSARGRQKGCLGRPGVAEYVLDVVVGEEVLNEFGASL